MGWSSCPGQTFREKVEPPSASIDDDPEVNGEITACATNARDMEGEITKDFITR